MKVFFFVVCLLDVMFFFWEFNKGALSPANPHQQNLPSILLLSELENARRSAALSKYLDSDLQKLEHFQFLLPEQKLSTKPLMAKSLPPAIKPASTCYEFGPFTDKQAAAAWMAAQSIRGEVIDKSGLIPASFMVYYPADKNPEQLRVQKMMLSAKGLTDFWVVPSGELKGVISLGVFNDHLRAANYKNQLSQLGIKAEIAERNKNESRLFVKVYIAQVIQHPLAGMAPVTCKVK